MTDSLDGSQFGKYRITALLGKGGMGEVYEAYDAEKGRTVALKILSDNHAHDERYRERFLRESRAAAKLQEPHVIPIHDWGEIDGRLYIDMRLVEGVTLHELIQAGPLVPERAVAILGQIAAALDAAHAENLIHRDIKPQNIIVTPADFAYLVDFGIAEARGDTRLTMDGTRIGSLAYMAPERFQDDQSTAATDTYSLACVLYETLTGTTPFPATSLEHLISAHVAASPPQASGVNMRVPAELDAVIARGMAKEPDDRYGSAGALGRAAQRALSGGAPNSSGISTSAATMAAPAWAPNPGPQPPPPPFTAAPYSVSTAVQEADGGTRHSPGPLVLAGIATAVLLGAVGMVIGLLLSKKGTDNVSPPPTTAPLTVAAPTVYQVEPAQQPVATRTVTQTQTALPALPPPAVQTDPEVAALAELRQVADADRPFVKAQLADLWVPQLSSKRPGIVDDGVVWDNARTLEEFQGLRQRYGARLLWSGDWSTFSAPNFWVTVVPATFTSADGALRWCATQRIDSWHCIAKLVSTTHPVAGSTATG